MLTPTVNFAKINLMLNMVPFTNLLPSSVRLFNIVQNSVNVLRCMFSTNYTKRRSILKFTYIQIPYAFCIPFIGIHKEFIVKPTLRDLNPVFAFFNAL